MNIQYLLMTFTWMTFWYIFNMVSYLINSYINQFYFGIELKYYLWFDRACLQIGSPQIHTHVLQDSHRWNGKIPACFHNSTKEHQCTFKCHITLYNVLSVRWLLLLLSLWTSLLWTLLTEDSTAVQPFVFYNDNGFYNTLT